MSLITISPARNTLFYATDKRHGLTGPAAHFGYVQYNDISFPHSQIAVGKLLLLLSLYA